MTVMRVCISTRQCSLECCQILGYSAVATRWFLVRLIFDPEEGDDVFLETSVYIQTARRHIAEDGNIYSYRC
jgi:hypothetical protein